MDADTSLGSVAGPKRISAVECARIRSRSGPDSPSPLMQRYDLGSASTDAPRYAAWPSQPRYPRPSASPEASGAAAVTAPPR